MRISELAIRFGCQVVGDAERDVISVGTLENAGPDNISFLSNPKYRPLLIKTAAGAVILSEADLPDCSTTALVHSDPYQIYARVADFLHPAATAEPGIHPFSSVSDQAHVATSANIGAAVVIESGASIGERCVIGPGCVVAHDAIIGNDTRLVANVTVCHGVRIGQRGHIHPGAVIGGDGFGIAKSDEGWIKVPQLGSVRIGDDVEIGASTTIDRGAIEDTVIGNGVKLDNQIQVAHNVHIGDHTVIAACSGVSGSTRIGRRCMIAGAVGFVGHLTICDDVIITGQTMVNRSITVPGVYSSALPMDEAAKWRRNSARFRRLDDMAKRLAAIEKNVKTSKI